MCPGAKEHACGKARYRYRLEVSLSWEFRSVPGSRPGAFVHFMVIPGTKERVESTMHSMRPRIFFSKNPRSGLGPLGSDA